MVAVPTLIVQICAAVSWIVTRSKFRWRWPGPRRVSTRIRCQPALCSGDRLLGIVVSNVVPLSGTILYHGVYIVCWISFGTRVLNNT